MIPKRLCVQWARLGPYHDARLAALHARLQRENRELVALETAGLDRYNWVSDTASRPYEHVTVFPQSVFANIDGPLMHTRVTDALDRIDADAVAIMSYSTPDARSALAWCRRHRRPAIMMFDSRAEDGTRVWWREAIKRRIVTQFDAALVAGEPQAAYAHALGIPKSHIFAPFDVVDNAWFATRAAAEVPGPSFLTVSGVLGVNNLDTLLRAHALYTRRAGTAAWPLVIVGDGPDRARLEALATSAVTFAGFQSTTDLPRFYGQAGAFVLPSLKDTWGLVVNEAMASGLPVIVSTGAGCADDLVDVGINGFIFDPTDEACLAELLARMAALSDGERARMGASSRARVAQYRPEDFADALCQAVEAGVRRADRRLTVTSGLVLGALRVASRRTESFQTIKE